MGNKRFSAVVDWNKHIEPYRIIQFVAGVGSGKNYWVENELMSKMKVLLVTSRKAKVEETSERLKIGKKLNFNELEKDHLMYFLTQNREDGSCVCNNWQIEYYMKHQFQANNPRTYLWSFFDIVIIDEIHSLATDATYADSPFYVLDFIKAIYRCSNTKVVLMTATFSPIRGLIKLNNKDDYAFWDVTDECRNLLPEKLWFQTTEQTLQQMVHDYEVSKKAKDQNLELSPSKWVYFATRTNTIANTIITYLVNSGIPENEIAVSFSNDEAEENFSDVILENKRIVEDYLKTHEDIPENINFFITTSRNKEGINIDNPNLYWNIAIESHWTDEAAQMWGRVRHGLNQHGDESLSPTNRVVIVHNAPQHTEKYCDTDYRAMLSACCVDGANKLLDHWCKHENLPLINRYNNPSVKSKIKTILQDFPYLRYSILNDKFQVYRGKVWGERSYCESVTNFKHYVAEWQGEGTGIHCVAPFSIKSFLICPPKQVDSFEAYIIKHGLADGKYMSKQEQDELLDFISNKLMLRQGKNKTQKYTSLAKAVRRYGWQLEPYKSKNIKSLMYGYARLIRMETEIVGGVWDDSI